MNERATVRVVTGEEPAARPNPAMEPEAMPPQQQMPPQELSKDIGGPLLQNPSVEDRVAASGGSLAEQMRARFDKIAATKEFAVPGWELDDGSPGLILVARAFGDRRSFEDGLSNEVFIARSTHRLYFVTDEGERVEVEGGWGPHLAEMMGVRITRAADLVARVISKPDPSNPGARIPNVAGIGSLATQLIAWARQGQVEAEESLGGS